MTFHILRIFTGHTLKVAESIKALGIEAYCPTYTVSRKHHWDRRERHEIEKPLFPGYLFPAQAFDVERINLAQVKTRLMARDGRYLTVTSIEMEIIREAEKRASRAWQPSLDDIIKGLSDCVDGVKPRKFMKLGDLKNSVAA